MPKQTFLNLPEPKQQLVLEALRQEFEEKTISEASVKDIVEKLGIARGSFYQYFEDLNDSFFTLLARETKDTHELFFQAIQQSEDLTEALEIFGEDIVKEVFKPETYALYRNRYLGFTPDLTRRWNAWRQKERLVSARRMPPEKEKMELLRAVVHALIERSFLEGWSPETFLSIYKTQIGFLRPGLKENK